MQIIQLTTQFKSIIEKNPFAKQYDKRNESDQQMLLRVSSKFAILFFIILMFDTLLEGFLALISLVAHLMYVLSQTIEYSLLVFLGSLFQLEHQHSEMIIVNAVIILTLYFTYRLILIAPELASRIKQYLQSAWIQHIKRQSSYWQAMTLTRKIKWLSAYSFGTSCLLLLMT